MEIMAHPLFCIDQRDCKIWSIVKLNLLQWLIT